MNVRNIRRYLEDWYRFEMPELVERDLVVDFVPGKAIAIVGPRRAGKTYYIYQLVKSRKDKSLYLNFEDPFLLGIRFDEVLDILNMYVDLTGVNVEYLFLDEVQSLRGWEYAVRNLLDKGFYVFITGSSSKLLSREITTQLRGRSLTYYLLPFSFAEFLKARRALPKSRIFSQIEKASIRNALREYLLYGGFPEAVLFVDLRERILREYYETIFFKDFVERHSIRNIELARQVYSQVLQNFSSEITVRRVINNLTSRGVRVDKNKVYNYVYELRDTMAVFFVDKYSSGVYERMSWPKKVYICDTGIATVMRFSEDIGKLMENVVYVELMRRTNKAPLTEIYYYKDYDQREVDFAVKEGEEIVQLIQVTYASTLDEVDKREINNLIRASENLRAENLLILSWDIEDEITREGRKIIVKPLWKWLLEY